MEDLSVENSSIGKIANDYNSPTSILKATPCSDSCALADSKANRNLTYLVFWISTFFIIGTTPYQVFFIIDNLDDNLEALDGVAQQKNSVFFYFFYISTACLALAHSTNIFIYYFCNSLYRETFRIYFKKIFFFFY